MIGKLNHVAIAVPNLAAAAARYRDGLGASVSAPMALPAHGVTVVFVELPNVKIELMEPLGADSPIAKFIAKNPEGGMHHLCFEVDDILAARDTLIASGARVIEVIARRGSARMASRCCFCTRRIFPARWSSSNRPDP